VGLAQRQAWLAKWKAALGTGPVSFAPASPAKAPVIPAGPTAPPPIPKPPEIKLPPPGQPGALKPGLAPTFRGRVAALFKPKG
jgi:putative chitinase